MKSVVAYVRSLFGWCEDVPATRTSFKRDRNDDDLSSDDDVPAIKKLRQLRKTNYPDIMAENDLWSRKEQQPKTVRYVPIQIEPGHPSTSTPNEVPMRKANRIQTVPIKFVGIHGNGESSPRSKVQTPTRPVIHAVLDNDDDQVTWIEDKPENPKKLYIDLDDNDEINNEEDNDEVIFVKKVSTPRPPKPYKFFYTTNNEIESRDEVDDVQYYRLKKIKKAGNNENTRNISKLRGSAGITKSYKTVPTIRERLLQSPNSNLSTIRKRCLNTNGNVRSTLSKVFDLEQKRSYQDLILKVANDTKSVTLSRPIDIINLADEVASFRNTQKAQKKALNEINAVEKDIIVGRESEIIKEYGAITIASINSSDSEVDIIQSDCSTSSSVKIDPVNTLWDSLKDRAVCRADWLAKLNYKYKQKKRDTREKLEDARRESDIISKVNHEQKLAHLAHKLRYELCIPECLIEEVPLDTELPQLTPEQEKLVDRALGPGPPGQLMIEKFNLRIHRRDLQTLAGLNWLNDEVINFYMNLLMQRSEERADLPKVYATNTFFYPKLMQSGQAGLRRWTRKVDIFAHDIMVIPVHLGVHWCLSLVDFKTRRIAYLDSMGSKNQPCLNALLQYLRDEHQDKRGQPFNDKGWTTENLMDIPQQMNGSDCGMFACTFAEFSCRSAPYTFTQSHMPYLRRKAALEILQGKLLL